MGGKLVQSVISIWPRNGTEVYSPAPDSCSRHGGHQFGHPQQIVCCPYKPGRQLRLLDPLESSPPESPNHLYPAKDLFYLLPESLAQTIPNMPRRSAINRRSAFALHILSQMRRDLPAAQHGYKPSSVVPLIAPKG